MSDPRKTESSSLAPKSGFTFNDIRLNVLIDHSGAAPVPFFVPKEIAEALEYADPHKLAKNIKQRWTEQMKQGRDWVFLSYAELKEKFDSTNLGHSDFNNTGMMLLTERGLNRALTLSSAKKALDFQDWIVDDVLSQIARDGSFSPHREVDPNGALRIKESELELERLRIQLKMIEAQAELQTANLQAAKSKALADLSTCIPGLGANAISALKIRSVELLTGEDLAAFKPRLEAVHTPTSMAHVLGVTPARVGRVITSLGLRGEAGMSEAILNTKANSEGHVKSWLYTDAAFDKIKVGVEEWKATQK